MNIIARAALYLYDGSAAAPIFPDKVGKPGDEAAAYLSTVADKLMASDGSRTTCVEPSSAQEEMLLPLHPHAVSGGGGRADAQHGRDHAGARNPARGFRYGDFFL